MNDPLITDTIIKPCILQDLSNFRKSIERSLTKKHARARVTIGKECINLVCISGSITEIILTDASKQVQSYHLIDLEELVKLNRAAIENIANGNLFEFKLELEVKYKGPFVIRCSELSWLVLPPGLLHQNTFDNVDVPIDLRDNSVKPAKAVYKKVSSERPVITKAHVNLLRLPFGSSKWHVEMLQGGYFKKIKCYDELEFERQNTCPILDTSEIVDPIKDTLKNNTELGFEIRSCYEIICGFVLNRFVLKHCDSIYIIFCDVAWLEEQCHEVPTCYFAGPDLITSLSVMISKKEVIPRSKQARDKSRGIIKQRLSREFASVRLTIRDGYFKLESISCTISEIDLSTANELVEGYDSFDIEKLILARHEATWKYLHDASSEERVFNIDLKLEIRREGPFVMRCSDVTWLVLPPRILPPSSLDMIGVCFYIIINGAKISFSNYGILDRIEVYPDGIMNGVKLLISSHIILDAKRQTHIINKELCRRAHYPRLRYPFGCSRYLLSSICRDDLLYFVDFGSSPTYKRLEGCIGKIVDYDKVKQLLGDPEIVATDIVDPINDEVKKYTETGFEIDSLYEIEKTRKPLIFALKEGNFTFIMKGEYCEGNIY